MEEFEMQHPDVDVPASKLSLFTKDQLQTYNTYKNRGIPLNTGYSVFVKMTASRLWKELSDEEKTPYNDRAIEMNYDAYFETLTPEEQNAQLLCFEGKLERMAAIKAEDGQPARKKQKLGTAVDVGSSSEVESEEDVDSDEDLEIPPKTTFQKPNSSLEMFCNSYMDKYSSKHPKLTKQDLKSTLATNQSFFKAEKMTEPFKIPASAAAYYVMTHHSKLDNLTPAEINVLWGKVSDKQKKTCIKEHKKKRKDYVVYEFEKFLRTLSPAELKYFHTKITKNRARDEENEEKKSSDEESESTSTNEYQTSCDYEASETSKKTVKPTFATLKIRKVLTKNPKWNRLVPIKMFKISSGRRLNRLKMYL